MFKERALLTFYAETPVHMGAGQSVSYVDLPVQRERITSFPTLWASGIKGVIRDLAERVWEDDKYKIETIFGPSETKSETEIFASCISITDAKILFYPVRSAKGIFAWITCPFVLKRFREDLKSADIKLKNDNNEELKVTFEINEDDKIIATSNNVLKVDNNRIVLEEFVFEIKNGNDNDLKKFADTIKNFLPQNELTNSLSQRVVIVSDNVFKDFVNYAVEVRTRVRIDQLTGTVKEGALFTEELIPSESIFYSLVFIADSYNPKQKFNADEIKNYLKELFNSTSLTQLGGDETIGRGFMKIKFYCESKDEETKEERK